MFIFNLFIVKKNKYIDSKISELETFTNPSFRDKGAVVVFPSWVRHRVTPVTRGTRYSAVAWFNGPPLR